MTLFRIGLIILFTVIIIFVSGCDQKPSEISLNEKLNFNESEYLLSIRNRFTDEKFFTLLIDSSFQSQDTLTDFYSTRNYQPIFIKSFEHKDFVDSLLALFSKAEEHGLIRDFYHFDLIVDQFYSAINDTINNPDRLTQLANCELLVSDAILKYAYHMRYGVVNPTKIFPDSYYLPVANSSQRDLFEPLSQGNIIQYLQDIQPKSEKYKKLQIALRHFNTYKNIEWRTIPFLNKKLEPGDKDSSVQLIAERLITLGLLDTSDLKIIDYTVYDSLLIKPVKHFQKLNGLNEDGVIGKGTIDKLNITPEEYIDKIRINLERFRWIDYSDTLQYILVNIPDFRLYAMENGKELFNSKVCTGIKRSANYQKQLQVYKKSKRLYNKPADWETPCLYGEISYLVLNPTWNVPQSIMREEILAGIKEDSSYLLKKNFKVYKDGVEINYNAVNLNDFALVNIPYRIIQDPGAGNVLGKIKFMFKNPFGVYLHDTPSRAPFNNSSRAVSHGCVRVEKPILLSEFILKDNSKWNIDFLKIEIDQKVDDKTRVDEYKKRRSDLRKNSSYGKTTEVTLDKKIPLFIDYFTAWVDDDGEIHFRDDVYRQDKILLDQFLRKEKPGNVIVAVNNL